MNTEHPACHDSRLHELLREARPNPDLRPRFQESVWRRIERDEQAREPASHQGWADRLLERLLRPRLALAGLAALLLASSLAGAANSATRARMDAQHRYLSAVAPFAVR